MAKKKELIKPELQTRTESFYDFRECSDYLEKKYGRVDSYTHEGEYRNFWHWICDNREIHNPCIFSFSMEEYEEMTGGKYPEPSWVCRIFKYFLDEFADENGRLYLEASW